MVGDLAEPRRLAVRLYTDACVVRGSISTTAADVYGLLTRGDAEVLELEDVRVAEHTTSELLELPFSRIAVGTILFGVSDDPDSSAAAIEIPAVPEKALLIVPPFRLTGFIHHANAVELRSALQASTGRFLPLSGAAYWSDSLREPRTAAELVVVNRERVQVLAPFQERDVWGDSSAGRRFEANRA